MRKGTKISRSFQLTSKETILHESRKYLLNMFFFCLGRAGFFCRQYGRDSIVCVHSESVIQAGYSMRILCNAFISTKKL